jgi:GWxTD domain-containing protein
MSDKKIQYFRLVAAAVFVVLLAGCGMNLVPSRDSWYMQHYIIMQDIERDVYKGLTEEGKLQFQALFWQSRPAESKKIFDRRMDFAVKQFRRENSSQPWNTDRARIYLLNGSPQSVDYKQTDNWQMSAREGAGNSTMTDRSDEDIQARTAEVWTYQFGDQYILYNFIFDRPKNWKLDIGSFSGNRFLGTFEKENRENTFPIVDLDAYKAELEKLKTTNLTYS